MMRITHEFSSTLVRSHVISTFIHLAVHLSVFILIPIVGCIHVLQYPSNLQFKILRWTNGRRHILQNCGMSVQVS